MWKVFVRDMRAPASGLRRRKRRFAVTSCDGLEPRTLLAAGPLGNNVEIEAYSSYVNWLQTTGRWTNVPGVSSGLALNASGDPQSDAVLLFDYRVNQPCNGPDPNAVPPNLSGTYHLSFNGQATIQTEYPGFSTPFTVQNQAYNASTNTTTADLVVPAEQHLGVLRHPVQQHAGDARQRARTPASATPGSSGPATPPTARSSTPTSSSPPSRRTASCATSTPDNANNQPFFSSNTLVTVDAPQVDQTGHALGVPVALANQTHTDMWINIPQGATDAYVAALAGIIKNGGTVNGVSYPGLTPNLKVYLEYSNEVWGGIPANPYYQRPPSRTRPTTTRSRPSPATPTSTTTPTARRPPTSTPRSAAATWSGPTTSARSSSPCWAPTRPTSGSGRSSAGRRTSTRSTRRSWTGSSTSSGRPAPPSTAWAMPITGARRTTPPSTRPSTRWPPPRRRRDPRHGGLHDAGDLLRAQERLVRGGPGDRRRRQHRRGPGRPGGVARPEDGAARLSALHQLFRRRRRRGELLHRPLRDPGPAERVGRGRACPVRQPDRVGQVPRPRRRRRRGPVAVTAGVHVAGTGPTTFDATTDTLGASFATPTTGQQGYWLLNVASAGIYDLQLTTAAGSGSAPGQVDVLLDDKQVGGLVNVSGSSTVDLGNLALSAGLHTLSIFVVHGSNDAARAIAPTINSGRRPSRSSPAGSSGLADAGFEAPAVGTGASTRSPTTRPAPAGPSPGGRASAATPAASPRATRTRPRGRRSPSSRTPAPRSRRRSPAGPRGPTASPSPRRNAATTRRRARTSACSSTASRSAPSRRRAPRMPPTRRRRSPSRPGRTPSPSWASTPSAGTTPRSSTPSRSSTPRRRGSPTPGSRRPRSATGASTRSPTTRPAPAGPSPGGSGVSGNGSGFTSGNPNAPEGAQVAFLQGPAPVHPDGRRLGRGELPHHLRRGATRQLSARRARTSACSSTASRSAPSRRRARPMPPTRRRRFAVAAGVAHGHLPGPRHRRRGQHRVHRLRRDRQRPRAGARRRRVRGARGRHGSFYSFLYDPAGAAWTFAGAAGRHRQRQRLHLRQPRRARGDAGRLPPGRRLLVQQTVAGWAAGNYRITFAAAQRGNYQPSRQDFQVLVDGIVVGTFTPVGHRVRHLRDGDLRRRRRVAHGHLPRPRHRRRGQHRVHRRGDRDARVIRDAGRPLPCGCRRIVASHSRRGPGDDDGPRSAGQPPEGRSSTGASCLVRLPLRGVGQPPLGEDADRGGSRSPSRPGRGEATPRRRPARGGPGRRRGGPGRGGGRSGRGAAGRRPGPSGRRPARGPSGS